MFRKKKKSCFFFFPGKVCKPLTRPKNWMSPKKGQNWSKKAKKTVLHIFEVFFFFSQKIFFLLLFFFFPGKVYTSLTHSISKPGKKKNRPEKKNTIFTHSLDICQKVVKNKLFRGKKKYGTFGWGSGFFFKIPIGRTVFNFSCKTSVFAGMGALFE